MVVICRLQANPELGEFHIHAALAQLGIDLSPHTCGRILALHRELRAPRSTASVPREERPVPFAAVRRHQYWSADVRYIEDHQLGSGKPVYVISVLENFSRAILASAISPRQDLTVYLGSAALKGNRSGSWCPSPTPRPGEPDPAGRWLCTPGSRIGGA